MSDEPKFCKDCKYFRVIKSRPVCTAHTNYSVVSGAPMYKMAEFARSYGQPCGEEAKKFEMKAPRWWEFWK